MTTASKLTTRRRIMGGALAAAAFPFVARGQQGRDPASQEPTDVRIRITFNDLSMTATLYDSPSARDLASMLPLDLRIEDFGSNEKICRANCRSDRYITSAAKGFFVQHLTA